MLITIDKQNEIKEVSTNNIKLITRIIKEVEELELENLLGSVFYYEIINNYDTNTDDLYKDLVEGCIFTDNNNNTILHKGLWYLLAYLNYSEYILESSIQDTFTGFVTKTRNDSETISNAMANNLRNKNREIAFNYYENTRKFLDANCDFFENYNKSKEKRVKNFKIGSVKKTL